VLPGELGGLRRPGERRADARHLVRGDLLAVARTADHDAEAARIADNSLRGAQHVNGVVVLRVIVDWAAVHGLMSGLAEPRDQGRLELEAGMVRSKVYTHRASLPDAPSAAAAPPGEPVKPTTSND
jgi:hypothetical protein